MILTIAEASAVPPRGRCDGMLAILRYNLPMYLATLLACAVAAALLAALPLPRPLAAVGFAGMAVALLWTVSSLLVSHWVYDRSPLGRWRWLADCFAAPPRQWATIHAGLDETRGALDRIFPLAGGAALDVYDRGEMTEPSIARARRLDLAPAMHADFRALPLADTSQAAIFLIFAAHELRRPEARERLFAEVERALAPGGRAVLVEHLRDGANFLAFGPGFLHFLPRREWLRVAAKAGLAVREELRITPFVAVLVLEKT